MDVCLIIVLGSAAALCSTAAHSGGWHVDLLRHTNNPRGLCPHCSQRLVQTRLSRAAVSCNPCRWRACVCTIPACPTYIICVARACRLTHVRLFFTSSMGLHFAVVQSSFGAAAGSPPSTGCAAYLILRRNQSRRLPGCLAGTGSQDAVLIYPGRTAVLKQMYWGCSTPRPVTIPVMCC